MRRRHRRRGGYGGDAEGDRLYEIENLEGSRFGDALIGSAYDNVLSGLAGNDTLYGEAGNDTLDGGNGDDVLQGGPEQTCWSGATASIPSTTRVRSASPLL